MGTCLFIEFTTPSLHIYSVIFIYIFDQQVHILIHSVVTDVDAKIPTFEHKINNRYYIIGLHSQTEH